MSARKDVLVAGSQSLTLESFSVELNALDLVYSRLSMLCTSMLFPVLAGVKRIFPTLNHGDKEECMLLHLLVFGPHPTSCRKEN